MLYQLTRPFAFLGIKHPTLTPLLRRAPVVVSMLITFIYFLMPIHPPLTGEGSLSRHMITVFAILPGFYIAALAAVATFNRIELDYIMPEPSPEMRIKTNSSTSFVKLTFRMFICQLFAFLTTLSFLSVFLFVAADLSSKSLIYIIRCLGDIGYSSIILLFLQLIYVFAVGWLSAQTVLTTMLGLYFLAERIHRN